jgi:hypothetical protein
MTSDGEANGRNILEDERVGLRRVNCPWQPLAQASEITCDCRGAWTQAVRERAQGPEGELLKLAVTDQMKFMQTQSCS